MLNGKGASAVCTPSGEQLAHIYVPVWAEGVAMLRSELKLEADKLM